ncbi:hypothetical protein ACLVL5_06290 [Streptococcus pneumoniae]
MNIVYIAVSVETGSVISGLNGQYGFGSKASMARSMGQVFGKGSKEKYYYVAVEIPKIPLD